MFDLVFKKKEEPRYAQLARQARVATQKAYREERKLRGKRPSSAPESSGNSPSASWSDDGYLINHRHSLGNESMFPNRATQKPLRFSAPDVLEPFAFRPPSAHSQNPRVPPNMEVSPCPCMMPSIRTPSVELRNPFRSGTVESVTSNGRTESFDSFADTGVPIHRSVRTFRPAHTSADTHTPQKAALFTAETTPKHSTVQPTTTTTASDPFTDTNATAGQSPSPVGMAGTTAERNKPNAQRSTSRRWSVLRSPKRASHDFLQVKIPTGIMSPVRESRLAFWSKA
ncbi:hypothetical protein C2E23DRAFT_884147 [Lenzites betulinus]|nr:hypothetical protein C2E23DRAFT_884147 [Lenzites betulinus]